MPYYDKTEGSWDAFDVLGVILVLLLLGGIILEIGALSFKLLSLKFSEYECRSEVTKLVALKDRFGEEGRFFLGSGSIDQKPYYVFYREDGKAIILDKVPAEGVKVYEEERHNAIMERYFLVRKGWKIHPAAVDSNCKGVIKFRIPKGTVVRSYNLDLR